MNELDIITDEEITKVHANANFGGRLKRDVVRLGILKCASGYYQGSTSTAILREHKLIDAEYNITAKGRSYLWAAFSKGSTF